MKQEWSMENVHIGENDLYSLVLGIQTVLKL